MSAPKWPRHQVTRVTAMCFNLKKDWKSTWPSRRLFLGCSMFHPQHFAAAKASNMATLPTMMLCSPVFPLPLPIGFSLLLLVLPLDLRGNPRKERGIYSLFSCISDFIEGVNNFQGLERFDLLGFRVLRWFNKGKTRS